VEVEFWMEVEVSGMAVDVESEKGKTRRLVQHGNSEIVNAARCALERELYCEGVKTPAGQAIGWSRLKTVPVFVAALANDKNGVAFGVGIVDAFAAKFAGGIIKVADLPNRRRERSIGGKC
jgi:hypothetical protein